MKALEKIRGTFRKEEQVKGFCNIRSFISGAHKQRRAMLTTLSNLISGRSEFDLSLVHGS